MPPSNYSKMITPYQNSEYGKIGGSKNLFKEQLA